MGFLNGRGLTLVGVCIAVTACLSACSRNTKVSNEAMGVLDSQGATEAIEGWAWDPNQPDTPIRVEVFADDKLLTSILADVDREDLVTAGKGNGKHGFEFPFPDSLRDGNPHRVSARIAEVNIELENSPQSLHWPPKAAKQDSAKPAEAGKPSSTTVPESGKAKAEKPGKAGGSAAP